MSFSKFLQENLLVLLTFDTERFKVVRGSVEPQMFGGFYKEIVVRVYDYIDEFKKPPGEHIADLLEDKLTSKNKREVGTYKDIIENIYTAKDSVNAEYVISQLESFVKRQSLRSIAVDLAKALQKDTEDSLEQAEQLIQSANSVSLKVFDAGLRMSNIDLALGFLNSQTASFPLGIPEFDRRGFGPTRKEMLLYIADTKTGKTWFVIQLAKLALMQNLKVLHVTLEMSEEKVSQRYVQTFFAMAKRSEKFITRRFKKDKRGNLDIVEKEVMPKLSLDDAKVEAKLRRRMEKWKNRILDNIIIKQFPTGKLTVHELEAYMDNLEITEKFSPDLLIVDYPDLMNLKVGGSGQYRHALAEVYKNLRGVAVARNTALAVPTQANRAGATAKTVGRTNVSEAYSKIADADAVLTYSQTEMEKTLGLARLSVIAGRNDEDNISVVISQNYGMGQYVVDSVMMNNDYWKLIDTEDQSSSDDDGYDEDDDE